MVKKYFKLKRIRDQKYLDKKGSIKFWVQENFESEKCWMQTSIGSQKNVVSKRMLCQKGRFVKKILGPKKCWV